MLLSVKFSRLLNGARISNFTRILQRNASTKNEVEVKLSPWKVHKLDSEPPSTAVITRKDALAYYRTMFTIRRLEQAAYRMYQAKDIRGFLHLYVGQEAICVGMQSALLPQDSIITAYRDHGWALVRGLSMRSILAELTGRATGCARGKGGSMHMYAPNFFGGNGIVGAQVPLGAGIALSHKYLNTGGLCVALYGDGAANQGQVFEAYNMAKLWELPAIFVCENNKYGMGTSVERASASIQYYTRGDYVPGLWVDGMDILSVREATRFAGDMCRAGRGPIVLEVETYRYFGHSMSDPGSSYRTREEIDAVRQKRDAINQFKQKIIEVQLAEEGELQKMEEEVQKEVDAVAEQARADPEPVPGALFADIYQSPPSDFLIRTNDGSFVPQAAPDAFGPHPAVGATPNAYITPATAKS